MKNKQKVPPVSGTKPRTRKLIEIIDVKDIEIGDTLRVLKNKRIQDEGVIEFIDFTIPLGNVLITINKKVYSGSLNFYLVKVGQRTPEQLSIKLKRLNQVTRRKMECDSGNY
jgi:hypothetical protein